MRSVITAILGLVLFITSAIAAERETLSVDVDGTPIAVHLYMPAGKGPFPLIVMSHGSPRNEAGRAGYGSGTLSSQASAYADEGVAVAVPIRRGYGGQGAWAENYGGCETANYYAAGLQSARDIRAAMRGAGAHAGIDRTRIVLMGVSAGGFGSVAAGTGGGVKAVVSFAGGRGSRGPDDVCNEANLVNAMGRYGAASRVPELWLYSENDHFFGPALAQKMLKAFNGAGGRATFIAAPAHGSDGHRYFEAVSSWKPSVDAYLKQVGFLK